MIWKTLISKKILILFLFMSTDLFSGADADPDDIAFRIEREIEEQVRQEDEVLQKKYKKEEELERKIRRAIDKNADRKMKYYAKQQVYEEDLKDTEFVPYIHKLPTWSRKALFFTKRDQVSADFGLHFATQAYGSSGDTRDISHLIFKESPIVIKDVLIASKLIDTGIAEFPTAGSTKDDYKFLDVLKDQPLQFDASTNKQQVTVNYVRHFLRGDVALGLQVPLVRRVNKIKLSSTISQALKNEMVSVGTSTKFNTLYPNGLIDFFVDILDRKGIGFNRHDDEVGLGDITIFFNYDIPTKFCERCVVGVDLLVPTAKRRDIHKLWDPELGNGGFTELSIFAGALFKSSRFWNPHVFADFQYGIQASPFRRVPRLRRTEDLPESTSSGKVKFGEGYMAFGNYLLFDNGTKPQFSELDTNVRHFSDTSKSAKLNPGTQLNMRFGNQIERAMFERMFFDLFYDLRVKSKDYLGFRRADDVYNAKILTDNTFQVEHRIGTALNYQFDDSWRANFDFLYSFAGRNVMRSFNLDLSISLEF